MSRDARPGGATTELVLVGIVLWVLLKLPDPVTFLGDADQGHQLAGATQILFGEHPFVDWHTTYGPLTFYASALAQRVSGQRIIGEMVLIVIGYGTAYLILFQLLWRAGGRASLALIVLALVLMPRTYKYYVVLGPVAVLWAAWRYVDEPRARSLVLLASAVALTGLFRSDFGVYAGVAATAAVAGSAAPSGRVRCARVAGLVVLVVGGASPWLVWVWHAGGLSAYFADSIGGGSRIASGMALPLPSLATNPRLSVLYAVSWALPACALSVLALRGRAIATNERVRILSAVVLAQGSLFQSAHRSEYLHLLQAIPVDFVLAVWLARRALDELASGIVLYRSVAAVGLGALASAAGAGLTLTTTFSQWPSFDPGASVEKLRVFAGSRDDVLRHVAAKAPNNWYLQAIRYVRACTERSDRILALPLLTTFFYMGERRFAGGQMGLAPGYFSTDAEQRTMIERLTREDVPLIIEMPGFSFDGMDVRKMEVFAPLVFAYLRERFVEVGRFGPAVVAVRRDVLPTPLIPGAAEVPCPRR
jgi:hypothetical protein